MPPKTQKAVVAPGDTITLSSRDAAAIRAAFVMGSDNWTYSATKIGEALGLSVTLNG